VPRAPAATHDTFLRPRAHASFLPPAVIVLPGNHDEALRDYLQDYKMELGSSITVQLEATHTTADGRRLRPDVLLRLPDARHLVIDSKVSLVAYERAVNAPDDTTRLAATREHAAAVRTHVEQLSAKQYEDTGKLITPDYVLMFVPLEPAFILAAENDRALYEWAFDRRVILCTAPTLLVTLKTVASLWKQDRQTKNVQAIATRGGLLYDKFAGLFADLEDIGKHLARLRESYDGALGKLKTGPGNLLAQVEDLKNLGAKAKKSLPSSSPEGE
jgi:DNA recombination protein RmuC